MWAMIDWFINKCKMNAGITESRSPALLSCSRNNASISVFLTACSVCFSVSCVKCCNGVVGIFTDFSPARKEVGFRGQGLEVRGNDFGVKGLFRSPTMLECESLHYLDNPNMSWTADALSVGCCSDAHLSTETKQKPLECERRGANLWRLTEQITGMRPRRVSGELTMSFQPSLLSSLLPFFLPFSFCHPSIHP